ncbi:MAG TPA: DcaP family trimeric outer membrane transporter [Vicinamibacterales bacterium]|nr:DcaP family trimeric outer membrane transporter [Vicinamibacterales bacterium]
MRRTEDKRRARFTRRLQIGVLLPALLILATAGSAYAQNAPTPAPPAPAAPAQDKPSLEVYGFAMLDIGHNFNTINPNWFDTMRVTRLPSFDKEFGEDNNAFAGVRQSRFGVRTNTPTSVGELKTTFEYELFGTGVDEGQTTFRLRHAYGELGQFLAGQTWSPFMDPDVFPNSLEYWGPTGMVFFRNVQLRWTPMHAGPGTLNVALERPGASGDGGIYADRIELQNVQGRFPFPDITGSYKYAQDWGYVRAAGALRFLRWDDLLDDQFDLDGDATGWGINLSSNVKFGKDVLRLQYVFGEGIQNYMNDSPVDVGIENNLSDPVRPIVGKALPIQGLVIFLDHVWNEKYSSTVGYSWQDIDNTDAMTPSSFKTGHYFLGNLLYYPAPNVMVGGELQWGRRENFTDGFDYDAVKLQFSFKYNFSMKVGG